MEGVSSKVNYYEFISQDQASRAVYLIHKEGKSILSSNYSSCDFIEAIAHVHDYPVAPFWFKKGSKIHFDINRL